MLWTGQLKHQKHLPQGLGTGHWGKGVRVAGLQGASAWGRRQRVSSHRGAAGRGLPGAFAQRADPAREGSTRRTQVPPEASLPHTVTLRARISTCNLGGGGTDTPFVTDTTPDGSPQGQEFQGTSDFFLLRQNVIF